MVKLFHFYNPYNYHFAEASRRGTWYPEKIKVCPECGASRQKRISPLILEWEPGSEIVGDFVWPGFDDELVVSQRVKNVFEMKYPEIEFVSVEYYQDPKLKQRSKKMNHLKSRVWLPYTGPIFWEVLTKHCCHLDLEKSEVEVLKKCSSCGSTFYKIPSPPNRNLNIDPNTWDEEQLFRIYENPGLFFCTEQVKILTEEAGFTNVSFIEDGVIPD